MADSCLFMKNTYIDLWLEWCT